MGKTKPRGFMDDISPEQTAVLEELKAHIKNNMDTSYYGTIYDDWYLLRFCRARKFKIKDIIKMFEGFYKWSVEAKIYDVWKTDYLPIQRQVEVHYPGAGLYYCTDKEGRPVHIEQLKTVKYGELLKIPEDDLVMFFVKSY